MGPYNFEYIQCTVDCFVRLRKWTAGGVSECQYCCYCSCLYPYV